MGVSVYKPQKASSGGIGGMLDLGKSVKGMFSGGGGAEKTTDAAGGGSDAMGQAGSVMGYMSALKSPTAKFQAIDSGSVHMAKPSQASAFPLIGKVVGSYFGGPAGGMAGGAIGQAAQNQVNGKDIEAVGTGDDAMARRMQFLGANPEEEDTQETMVPSYFNRLRQLRGE